MTTVKARSRGDQRRDDVLIPYRVLLPKVTPAADPLDDPAVWHDLIMRFVTHPMNYGSDIHAVGTIARAAGIEPSRAIARVLAYYHHDASRGVQ